MIHLSNVQEDTPMERKLFLGVENFYPVALNPTMKELNDMGIPATMEPDYVGQIERDFGSGPEKVDFVRITIFLDNKDSKNNIRQQVSYTIYKKYHLSSTGKYLVINKFGGTTWLEPDSIKTGKLPSNMTWYLTDEVKKAYRGEENVITFIKTLRNLPNISSTSSEEVKQKGIAMFEESDLDKLFKGDFTDLRNTIINQSKDCKIGFMLGVRDMSVDGNSDFRQSVYREPVKAYVRATNKTEYLVSRIKDAQDNGAYSDVIFDLNDTTLKEFKEDDMIPKSSTPVYTNTEEDDDLPF